MLVLLKSDELWITHLSKEEECCFKAARKHSEKFDFLVYREDLRIRALNARLNFDVLQNIHGICSKRFHDIYSALQWIMLVIFNFDSFFLGQRNHMCRKLLNNTATRAIFSKHNIAKAYDRTKRR